MNMKDELFNEFDIDLETANRIAKEYPSLSDSARERMFNMTKEKMNITNDANEANNNSVHGVEKYNRPRWIKFAGMAAAVAIIAGGVGGGSYLLHNMNKTAPSTSSSSETEVTTTSSVITDITTTAAVVETTTVATEVNDLTPEEAAHKLTDNYWDYECFFDYVSHSKADYDESKNLKFNYTMQYDGYTPDIELVYCRTIDERLTEKSMDGLRKLYNTYFSKNYDPFYSVNAEYTNNYELFGPSFTADTLPADGRLDRDYTYIEYEGELYQYCPGKDYFGGYHWSDEQVDISDVTEGSFTLNRKFENDGNEVYEASKGEVTFKIVFDEAAQDWRIEQKDVEYEYQNTAATTETNRITPEEAAHKLTDDYYNYAFVFGVVSSAETDLNDELLLKYMLTAEGVTSEETYSYRRVVDEKINTMDKLKADYYSHYTDNYDPYVGVEAPTNQQLFGPSYTTDTLPKDGFLDRAYTFIEYNGNLYAKQIASDFTTNYSWINDQIEISEVADNSFTAKRNYEKPRNEMSYGVRGTDTFKIVFDETAKDWRIDAVESTSEFFD